MRTKSVIVVWTCLLSLGWFGGVKLQGENQENQEVVSDNDISKRQLSPFEEGLQPFYQMTNIFLGIVQNKEPAINQQAFDQAVAPLVSLGSDEPQPDVDWIAFLRDDWQSFALYGVGYLVCLVVGVLFIIIMPIVGCCFCCCRLCGRCGGKTKPNEGRHHKCRQYTCGTLLFIFNTVMLVGMIFAFLSNEQIRIRTSAEPEGLVPRAQSWLNSLNGYTDSLVDDVERISSVDLENSLESILQILRGLPEATIAKLDTLTNTTHTLNQAASLARDIEAMKRHLNNIQDNKTELMDMTNSLTGKLTDVKDDVRTILNTCGTTECTTLVGDIDSLQVTIDFSQADQDVSSQIAHLNSLGNVTAFVADRQASYQSIKNRVTTEIQNALDQVESQKDVILADIQKSIKDLTMVINNATGPLKTINGEFKVAQGYISEYGDYWWYAGIGLSCVFLLIVLCYYLGLMFGACGEPPYEDANACNKGVGANLLLAGVGFCFLFCSLLMLICMLLFIPGAVVHGEMCRHLSPDLANSPYLKPEEYLSLDNKKMMSIADEVSYPFIRDLNITNNVSKILQNCQQNEGIYKAVGLYKLFDLNIINVDNYDIKAKLDDLTDLTLNLNGIEIIDDATRDELNKIKDSNLDTINFAAFFAELDKSITSENLDMVIDKLRALQLGTTERTEMDAQITKLENIQTNDITEINTKKGNLRVSLDSLMNLIDGQKGTMPTLKQKTEALIQSLDAAQANIDDSTTVDNLKAFFKENGDLVYSKIQEFSEATRDKVENDVGKCRRLYDIASGTVNLVCVDFLYPYNGFWFSFGWCLAFFIPAIITAVHLAGSYRKTEEFDPTDTKSFDDPNFDAYSGGMFPGDNIPLEDYDRRKNRPAGRGGHPNSAYETDGHPSSRAPPAAMPYRDNYSRDNYARNGGPPAYPGSNAGGYGGRGGGYGGATPPNPPHYYNNRPGPY